MVARVALTHQILVQFEVTAAMTALKVPLSKITRTFNIAEMEKKSLARVITLKSVMAVITSAPIWSYHLMARI